LKARNKQDVENAQKREIEEQLEKEKEEKRKQTVRHSNFEFKNYY
jgi:hypothetical protein